MKIFLLTFVVCSVKAQNSFVLQFLGDSLSQEEATERELCGTKHCLSDSQYLFSAATQNKSVRPCDDFKEFALGTFDKYQSVSDRSPYSGFLWDLFANYYQKVKRVLSEPVNVNDSRISKGLKTFYAKCLNSKNIRKNGVSEAREYLRSLGLKFYPEKNDKDFNLKNYFEQEGTNTLKLLFFRNIFYYSDQTDLYLQDSFAEYASDEYLELQLESYETMLYEMNQIYRNSSFSEEFKKEFKEIANRQIEFYHQLKILNSSVVGEDYSEWMTIYELNNSTSTLNLDWLTIINNKLITKINSSTKILVDRPQSISKIAEFLVENDKDVIADYLVYKMLYDLINGFLVYVEDKYTVAFFGANRAYERWLQCQGLITSHLTPALDALYLQRYFDKKSEDSLRKFAHETIEFALKKIKSTNQWGEEVLMDVTKKLQSVKFIFGYSEEFVGTKMLEHLYGDLDFEQNLIKVQHKMIDLHHKLRREPKIREILELGTQRYHKFTYRLKDNIIFIESFYLDYPFYHDQRPRFYNTANVASLILKCVFEVLFDYLFDKYELDIPEFEDHFQYGYEFYESWLESGEEELNLGANRLTNRQLYWIAVARKEFRKFQAGIEISLDSPEIIADLNEFHKYISKNPGFKEAYDCDKV